MPNVRSSILKPNSVIGIFGGGQLGRMICFAAHKLGYRTIVFSDVKNSPASLVTNRTIVADFQDQKALTEFANSIDIATLEFENIPVSAIEFISKLKPVYPDGKVLSVTQNRIKEKDFLRSNKIAVTDYYPIGNLDELESLLKQFSEKFILKTATMGYDGKGQWTIDKKANLQKVWQEVNKKQISGQEMIVEKFADFKSEISVIAARDLNGNISCYNPLTNVHKKGILDQSIYPAQIGNEIANTAKEITTKIAKNLNLVGLIAVEFFVMRDDKLLVNELAPRPHNSGHFSLDACVTNQFEQLVRAITGIGLGSTKFHSTGYMKNLIGPEVLNIEQYYQDPNAKIHLYGKSEIKNGRKLGHINFLE